MQLVRNVCPSYSTHAAPFTLQHVARKRSTPLQCRVRPQEQESVKVFKLNFLQVYRGSEFQPISKKGNKCIVQRVERD